MIIDGALIISKKKKAVLVSELKEKGFKPFPKVAEAVKAGEDEPVVEEDESDSSDNLSNAYDYLLGMPIWSLTQERVERLRRQIGDKEVEIDTLIKLSKEDIWKRDLDDFIAQWRFELEDEDRRLRKASRMGRRTSSKLMTGGGRAPAARKRKAADDDDEDFGVPKSKKKPAAAKKTEPKGGLMAYLSKPPPKPKASPSDGADDSDEDFALTEVLPKKSRGRPKVEPKPAPKPKDEDEDSMAETMPKGPSASKSTKSSNDEDDFEIEELPEEPAPTSKPAKGQDDDDFEIIDEPPKKGRGAAKAKPKAKDDDSDDDFMEIAKETISRRAAHPSRPTRQPVKYTASSDSDSDNGDDMLGDVSKMVKGIGGGADSTSDSRQLFSERSRPGSSAGLKTSAKASKFSNDFDPDETDYSKLVPQNSPRRSLQVKPKDVKVSSEDDDVDMEDEPVKPAAKGKAAAAPKTTATKGRGRPKKDAAKPAPAPAPTQLSPAAKAYASKQAKTNKKKLADDLSDDDIDAMANDILDSPGAGKAAESEDEAPRKAASRPARRTAAKKTYVIDDDSEDGAGDSEDDFDDEDSD